MAFIGPVWGRTMLLEGTEPVASMRYTPHDVMVIHP